MSLDQAPIVLLSHTFDVDVIQYHTAIKSDDDSIHGWINPDDLHKPKNLAQVFPSPDYSAHSDVHMSYADVHCFPGHYHLGQRSQADAMQLAPMQPKPIETRVPRLTKPQWQSMRPWIVERYRTATAREIVAELRLMGILITEKMLKDRFRQWRMYKNNRRFRSVTRSASFPPSIGHEEVERRDLLTRINHWYGTAWGRGTSVKLSDSDSNFSDFQRCLGEIGAAYSSSARFNTRAAWKTIHGFGLMLDKVSWNQLPPTSLTWLLALLASWQNPNYNDDSTSKGIGRLLRMRMATAIAAKVGFEHPLSQLISIALSFRLTVQLCQQILAQEIYHVQNRFCHADQDILIERARLENLRSVYHLGDYTVVQELAEEMEFQSPDVRWDLHCCMGRTTYRQGRYSEAETFFSIAFHEARDPVTAMCTAVRVFKAQLKQRKWSIAAQTLSDALEPFQVKPLTPALGRLSVVDKMDLENAACGIREEYEDYKHLQNQDQSLPDMEPIVRSLSALEL